MGMVCVDFNCRARFLPKLALLLTDGKEHIIKKAPKERQLFFLLAFCLLLSVSPLTSVQGEFLPSSWLSPLSLQLKLGLPLFPFSSDICLCLQNVCEFFHFLLLPRGKKMEKAERNVSVWYSSIQQNFVSCWRLMRKGSAVEWCRCSGIKQTWMWILVLSFTSCSNYYLHLLN